MGSVSHTRTLDRRIRHGRQVISPVKTGHQRDDIFINGVDDIDHLFVQGFPLRPLGFTPRILQCGRFVEQFVHRSGRNALIAIGDVVPETQRLLRVGVVHRMLIIARGQETDGVPVDNEIHLMLVGPDNCLVNQLEVFLLPPLTPGARMNRQTHGIHAPILQLLKQAGFPLLFFHQLIGVRYAHPTEHKWLAFFVNKLIAFNANYVLFVFQLTDIKPADFFINLAITGDRIFRLRKHLHSQQHTDNTEQAFKR